MAKHAAVSTSLMSGTSTYRSPLGERLNQRVLQTIRDLATAEKNSDPGIEDEYEFEIFGNKGPPPKKKKK